MSVERKMTASPDDRDLLEPAFVIEDVNDEFDLDIPPTSGMEYLRRVQWAIICLLSTYTINNTGSINLHRLSNHQYNSKQLPFV